MKFRYEMSSNYQGWRPATPKENLIKLLEENPGRTITIEDNDGSFSKWRRVSRNKEIVTHIEDSIISNRNTTNIRQEAELIYDKLEAEGHLK